MGKGGTVSQGKRPGRWSLLASVSGTGPPLGSSRVSGVVFLISQRKTSVVSETHVAMWVRARRLEFSFFIL